MDPERRIFHAFIEILSSCPDPYLLARELLVPMFEDLEELRIEIGAFVDDLVTLCRVEGTPLPEALIEEIRSDLATMQELPKKLGELLTDETKRRCGKAGGPLLVGAIIVCNNWMEFASDWLDSAERLRIRTDVVLGRLSRDRRLDRRDSGSCSRETPDTPKRPLVVSGTS